MTSARLALLVGAATLAVLAAGIGIGRGLWPPAATGGSDEREVLYWVAPMDRNYRRDKPGKSPMGMDLVPVYANATPQAEDPAVVIDPAVVQNLGMRSAPAQRGPLQRRIEAVGYVQYDEDAMRHIHTRVEGWIETIGVKAAGDPVRKGQTLFEIYSPTLVNAQREYLAALAGSSAELTGASQERLTALGMDNDAIDRLTTTKKANRRVRIVASVDGVATHLGAREGIYVTPATHVVSIADLNRVWVVADVFERQAAWVKPGQRAQVLLDHLPGRLWEGAVDYVYPALDASTRTLRVRIRFDNQGESLRPNMFARVTLFSGDSEPVIHIPREALIRGGEFDRVALDLGGGRFDSRRVTAGLEAGDRVEIRDGLEAGERVVTSGQFLIDSESNLATALERSGVERNPRP